MKLYRQSDDTPAGVSDPASATPAADANITDDTPNPHIDTIVTRHVDVIRHRTKMLRKRWSLTQPELAKLCGISRIAIARIEGGDQKSMHIGTLLRLALVFQVPL